MSRSRVLPFLFCAVALTARAQSVAADVVISQVYGGGGNAGAMLRNDFIELFNRGAAAVEVSGWSIQYSSAAGSDWQVTRLTGILAPGHYYLIQEAAGAGGTITLPVPDATGEIAMSATAGKVALVSDATPLSGAAPASAAIVDAIGYGATVSLSETAPAPGLTNTTAALRVANGCTDTNDNSRDFRTGAPQPRNSAVPAVSCGVVPPDRIPPSSPTRISEVQGRGDRSPLASNRVQVRGIVTGIKPNGFFIQATEEESDSDPATSEGLFIFTNNPFSPPLGTSVLIDGTVAEFGSAANSLTEITDPFIFTSDAPPRPLPAPVVLTPEANWEALEGMHVLVPQLVVSGPTIGNINERSATATSTGLFYGYLPPSSRPFRLSETDPDPVHLLRVDTRTQGSALDVSTGNTLQSIQGILDVSSGTYSLLQDAGAQPQPVVIQPAQPVPPAAEGEIMVASMNLQRFFDDKPDPTTSDPVLTTEAFERRIVRAARAIQQLLRSPDVIGVAEVENLETLRALATAAGGYDAYLFEGNDIGGIDVGFLVRRDRVQVIDVIQIGKDETYAFQGRNDLLWDRPPLMLRARAFGQRFTVIMNHLRSLVSASDPRVAEKRRQQGFRLGQIVYDVGPSRAIVAGDFNAFAGSPSILDYLAGLLPVGYELAATTTLTVRPVYLQMTNLTMQLPVDQRYTYVENGVAQALDHIFVTPDLLPSVMRYNVAHIDADYPDVLRNDASRLERISDHDFPVVWLRLAP